MERMFVADQVNDRFKEKFVAQTKAMKLSAGLEWGSDMGSLISQDQLDTVTAHVEDAVAKGATVLAGGKARPDVGPLVSVYPVDDVEEAIARANDTEYGLNASVWAGSRAEGEAIAARLRSGTVNVDEGYSPAFGSTAAPMGGMKASGVGRRHGPDGLLKYTESQTVATMRGLRLDPPRGMSQSVWQRAFVPLIRGVQRLPRR
jgi:succinate-semialdehyde dehydrogenase/glutarate-semialdehyde dehydrogenase